jgi:hypothetical protein
MLKINKILFGLILLLIVAACKTPQKATQTDTGLTLPESYTNQSDTINSGDLNWQSYFQDDNLKSLIQSAITNNFDVLSAVQKIEIAQNQFNLRQSQLLPNANVVAGAAQRKFGLFTMDGAGNASGKLLEYIEENIGTDLPEFYKGPGESTLLAGVQKNWFDKTTSFVFDNLVGRAHNQLDRSPLWRQEYTKEINRLAPLLSAEAAAELKEILITRTAHYNTMAKSKKIAREFTLKDYVGRNAS